MWEYLIVLLSLSALCAGWILFQMWLHKHDPKKSGKLFENRCGGCASGGCAKSSSPKRQSSA